MSKLRKQLHQASREYSAMRYPGDLSADVLDQISPPVRSHWMRNIAIAAGLAIAATALTVAMNRSGKTVDGGTTIAKTPDPGSSLSPNEHPSPSEKEPEVIAKDESEKAIDAVARVQETVTETMKDTVEESWSLSPAYVASAEESSVSIVPSYESISFSLPGVAISGIDTYVEQEETDTSVVQ